MWRGGLATDKFDDLKQSLCIRAANRWCAINNHRVATGFLSDPQFALRPPHNRVPPEQTADEASESVRPVIACVVTHELASIFTIGSNSVILSPEKKTQIATGNPVWLRDNSEDPAVREFLNRGEKTAA